MVSQLRADVDVALPEHSENPEPSWQMLVLANPDAPVTSISRDARAGLRLTPVYFIRATDSETFGSMMMGLYEGTGALAPLFHQLVRHDRPFLVVPLMYHLVDARSFCAAVEEYLGEPGFEQVVWFKDSCEVRITHRESSFRAVPGGDGSVQVISRAI